MLWSALLLPPADGTPSPTEDALRALAIWALNFTPRVAIGDGAVLMEVEASTRLFGGKRALRDRVFAESQELGASSIAWAPNSLAALALARAGIENGFKKPLEAMLDGLPMLTLSAAVPHQLTLAHIGCRTLGDIRRLPRGGVSRRFDKALLRAMDQAYGLQPEAHAWVVVPDSFHARLELMFRVDLAPAMLFGARRLLLQLCGWLAARRAGVTAFTLKWCHDVLRSKTAGDGGELTVRTAEATRNLEHLVRLLAEHLAKVQLLAPVGDLELIADEVHPLQEKSMALLPDPKASGESLALVLERIAARLGPECVLRPVLQEDHRLEWQTHWQPAAAPQPRKMVLPHGMPQPSFVLPEPLRLAVKVNRPLYQGPLMLLSGPHRVEGGWWDRVTDASGTTTRIVIRDYWVALSGHAGVLWIFQTRLADDDTAWWLHGIFA